MNNYPTFTLLKYSLFTTLFFSCSINKHDSGYNKKTNNIHLEGMISRKDLQQAPYKEWFNSNYNNYQLDLVEINKLKEDNNWKHNTQIIIYMGTWCGDSQEQVPSMLKVLDEIGFNTVSIIALDTDKKSKNGYETDQNIIRVPTFIFKQNRNEIGRIIETPVKSLEKDIVSIIINKEYTPHSFE